MLEYTPAPFSQGRMDFAWEELTEEERAQAYADWQAGRGLIGGDPRQRPGSHLLPAWGVNQPFFRTLALDDPAGDNGSKLRALLASDAPLEVEIGFGRGDFLLDRAKRYP
jgi:tRNA (guanine-N7-)-methyltransferase